MIAIADTNIQALSTGRGRGPLHGGGRVSDPRTQLVAETYDAIADEFVAWQRLIVSNPGTSGPMRFWRGFPAVHGCSSSGVVRHARDRGSLSTRSASRASTSRRSRSRRARVNVPERELHAGRLHRTERRSAPRTFDGRRGLLSFNHVPRDLLAPCSPASTAGSSRRALARRPRSRGRRRAGSGTARRADVLLRLPT